MSAEISRECPVTRGTTASFCHDITYRPAVWQTPLTDEHPAPPPWGAAMRKVPHQQSLPIKPGFASSLTESKATEAVAGVFSALGTDSHLESIAPL